MNKDILQIAEAVQQESEAIVKNITEISLMSTEITKGAEVATQDIVHSESQRKVGCLLWTSYFSL